jgi:carbon storage regulator
LNLGSLSRFLEPNPSFCLVSLKIGARFVDSRFTPLTVILIRETNRKLLSVGDVAIREIQGEEKSMLVLSRKKNESIVINDDISIVVVEIRGDKVRLGVEAPKEVPVHRREVYDAIKRAEMESEKSASEPDTAQAE